FIRNGRKPITNPIKIDLWLLHQLKKKPLRYFFFSEEQVICPNVKLFLHFLIFFWITGCRKNLLLSLPQEQNLPTKNIRKNFCPLSINFPEEEKLKKRIGLNFHRISLTSQPTSKTLQIINSFR